MFLWWNSTTEIPYWKFASLCCAGNLHKVVIDCEYILIQNLCIVEHCDYWIFSLREAVFAYALCNQTLDMYVPSKESKIGLIKFESA